jgi:uncharacterized protein YkwD
MMKKVLWLLFLFCCVFLASATAQEISPNSIEQAVLNEMNVARKTPKVYLGYLEEYRRMMNGKTVTFPNGVTMETIEGTVAVDEAINYLKNVSDKLDSYKFSEGLAKPANVQLKDLMENNGLSHFGKDGSNLPTRISRFGSLPSDYAENITYYVDLPKEIVMTMIIDDGIAGRSHRKNLFSQSFRVVGIAYGKGKASEGLCVTVFADYFRELKLPKGVRKI